MGEGRIASDASSLGWRRPSAAAVLPTLMLIREVWGFPYPPWVTTVFSRLLRFANIHIKFLKKISIQGLRRGQWWHHLPLLFLLLTSRSMKLSSWWKQVFKPPHLPFPLTGRRSDEGEGSCGPELGNCFPSRGSHGGKRLGYMEASVLTLWPQRWSGLDYQPQSLLCGDYWLPELEQLTPGCSG